MKTGANHFVKCFTQTQLGFGMDIKDPTRINQSGLTELKMLRKGGDQRNNIMDRDRPREVLERCAFQQGKCKVSTTLKQYTNRNYSITVVPAGWDMQNQEESVLLHRLNILLFGPISVSSEPVY